VSPVKYELGFYIPEDSILHSHYREDLESYKAFHFYYLLYERPIYEPGMKATAKLAYGYKQTPQPLGRKRTIMVASQKSMTLQIQFSLTIHKAYNSVQTIITFLS
jgi:hypothetical protein